MSITAKDINIILNDIRASLPPTLAVNLENIARRNTNSITTVIRKGNRQAVAVGMFMAFQLILAIEELPDDKPKNSN